MPSPDSDLPIVTPLSGVEESLPSPGPSALTPDERATASETAQRLRLELLGLIELLPEGERAASAMARALKIDRNICQRVMNATAKGEADARMLVLLPGVAGLRDFVEALARRLKKPRNAEELTNADAAIDRFEQLIEHLAGSQRKLRERLEADREVGDGVTRGPSDDLAARRALFRAAAEVVGRWSETWISMSVIRPVPGEPSSTESVRLRGLIGHSSRPVAVPLEVGWITPGSGQGPAPASPAFMPLDEGSGGSCLMPAFCSRPLPRVTSRAAGTRIAHVIEAAETATPTPSDIVVVDRRGGKDRHPASLRPAIGEATTLVTFPARRLVFDVWLHREIARRCLPSLELHLYAPHVGQQALGRWSTRFPGGPRLQLLGSGLEQAPTSGYARHAEMTGALFEALGWESGEFVGYRCDLAYPVWRAGYVMLFDFTGNEMAAG